MKWKGGMSVEELRQDIELYGLDNPLEAWETIHRIASNPKYYNTGYCGIPTLIPNIKKTPSIFPCDCFKNTELHEFEGLKVPSPQGYDKVLSVLYGDYMKFPPVSDRGIKTDGIIFDPIIPYKEFDFNHLN